jgi:hypothetical protein
MYESKPLPSVESEGLEYGQRQSREGGTDDTNANDIFLSLIHGTAKVLQKAKSEKESLRFFYLSSLFVPFIPLSPAIRHKTMQNIPDICRDRCNSIPLQPRFFIRRSLKDKD